LRTARTADAAGIADLLAQLGYPSTTDEVAERLRYWHNEPHSVVILAASDDELFGCIAVHAAPHLEHTGWWARIESLIVDAAVRGRGVGGELVRAAEVVARGWQCRAVEVTSSRQRADADAFYRRAGYMEVSDQSGRFWKEL
jgi:N-acetylglutamate synthase-like GNAT family acetyltransferase